jgi:hypothetical protein
MTPGRVCTLRGRTAIILDEASGIVTICYVDTKETQRVELFHDDLDITDMWIVDFNKSVHTTQ